MKVASRKLSAEEWRKVFRRVAEHLPQEHTWRVTVIGGVAIALGYDGRRTTDDADVVATAPEVFDSAKKVALEFGLPPHWMNRKAEEAGYVAAGAARESKVVFRAGPLEIAVPSPLHMLAMKLARWASDTDIQDSKLLFFKTPRVG